MEKVMDGDGSIRNEGDGFAIGGGSGDIHGGGSGGIAWDVSPISL
jgi:hypothetical protein